jgi:hypothetical protein
MHMRETFQPIKWDDILTEQKKKVLESHLFLKLKRDGTIKARTVAGGNRQRGFISKEDATSPTAATESVLLTAVIDALEERDATVVDIPNAFIQTRIRGELVYILVEIAPATSKPFVNTKHKGDKTLVVRCQNVIYGQYYKKFTKNLLDKGFILNPNDPCVANKTVDGSQITICFHVDDCKISHRSARVVDKTIEWLRRNYESIFEDGSGKMKVSRGKVHEYVGMTLDSTIAGVVRVTALKFIDEIIETFSRFDSIILKATAAPEDLFKVDEDDTPLLKHQEIYQHPCNPRMFTHHLKIAVLSELRIKGELRVFFR